MQRLIFFVVQAVIGLILKALHGVARRKRGDKLAKEIDEIESAEKTGSPDGRLERNARVEKNWTDISS